MPVTRLSKAEISRLVKQAQAARANEQRQPCGRPEAEERAPPLHGEASEQRPASGDLESQAAVEALNANVSHRC